MLDVCGCVAGTDMGKQHQRIRNRPPRSRRRSKVAIKKLIVLAKQKSQNRTWTHTTDITQKRSGQQIKNFTKRIEVRAWSERKLRSRLSQDNDPKIGRYTWSHEGQNSVIVMYPHVDEPASWGVCSSFEELKLKLTRLGIYDHCFSTAVVKKGIEDKLKADQDEFENFVKTKLVGKTTTLAWFKLRVLSFSRQDKQYGN